MINVLIYVSLAAFIVVVLASLRNRLVFELSALSLLLFATDKPGIVFYAMLVLPGTIIHELSHWLVAEILRVPTGKITILPTINTAQEHGNRQNLGSVATGTVDPFRGLLIGAAPFLVGVIILLVLATLVRDSLRSSYWWQIALFVYGIIVMGNSMLVSESDRHNWPIAIGVIVLLFISLWYLGVRLTDQLISKIESILLTLIWVLLLTTSLNLGTIGVSVFLRRLVEIVSHKKIIRN